MMKRELPGYVIADSYEEFTAVAVEAADQYTALIPTIVNNRAATGLVGALRYSGVAGGTATGTPTSLTVRAYGFWDADDGTTSAFKQGLYLSADAGWTTPVATFSVASAANVAGSKVFLVGSAKLDYSGGFCILPPQIQFRIDKEGDGTLTAGTIGIHWKMIGV